MLRATEIHRAPSPFYALATEGGTVFGGCGDGSVLAWTPEEPDRIRMVARAPAPVFALAALDVDSMALGTQAGELIVLDRQVRSQRAAMFAHAAGVHAIAALPDGALVSAGADGCLAVWRMDHAGGLRAERRIPLLDGKLRAVQVSADGKMVVVAGADGRIRLLDTERYNEHASWPGHEGGTTALLFHPSKPALVSGGKDGHVRVWDLHAGNRELLSLAAHRSTVYALCVAEEGRTIVSASRDKTLKRWASADLSALERLDATRGGHARSVNAACTLGQALFSAGDDGRLLRWLPDQNG